ncbi:AraC family transcriptional regulator [Nitratireductor mangrovi]|uniref:AraC family transcriptional regulator n=2 Tax=Nitratireductor mangrovi TaxID=2599600 RepID=A0A5B8L5V9_9HYPH|nr:AraC family transcriptional regulator [Nitratireductor mangrovi]
MWAEEGSRRELPLSRHVLFDTDDLDCARERVARIFCSHRLEIIGQGRSFRATHRHVPGEMISLNYISYGADVMIDPGALDSFYLIQMPIAGAATIRNGGREFLTGPQTASVLNADLETRMRWWSGCGQLLIQVSKAPFLAFAEKVFDRALPGPLVFDPCIDFTRPEMNGWRALSRLLFEGAEAGVHSGIQATFNEQRLMEAFLTWQPSNMTLFLDRSGRGAAPRHLRRAEEFIRENSARAITVLDIAQAAGVTPRTLQLAFRDRHGVSPMRALQRERMRRVRFDLLDGGEGVSVTDVALKWGFAHLGRFSAAYRREFGELPSETARRTRAN